MSLLDPRCSDCGRPVPAHSLCPACEQDRAMQQQQMSSREIGKGLPCNE